MHGPWPSDAKDLVGVEARPFELALVDPDQLPGGSAPSRPPVSARCEVMAEVDVLACEAVAIAAEGPVTSRRQVLDRITDAGIGRVSSVEQHSISSRVKVESVHQGCDTNLLWQRGAGRRAT